MMERVDPNTLVQVEKSVVGRKSAFEQFGDFNAKLERRRPRRQLRANATRVLCLQVSKNRSAPSVVRISP